MYPSRTFIPFLQEFVRFHFQDLGRLCIILASILEDLKTKCLILEVTWKKMPDLGNNLEENA